MISAVSSMMAARSRRQRRVGNTAAQPMLAVSLSLMLRPGSEHGW